LKVLVAPVVDPRRLFELKRRQPKTPSTKAEGDKQKAGVNHV
jgi:hypothetical protein